MTVAGHSTGAVCALRAAARGAQLGGLVLYEPPWSQEGWVPPTAHADEMDELIAAGQVERALKRGYRWSGCPRRPSRRCEAAGNRSSVRGGGDDLLALIT